MFSKIIFRGKILNQLFETTGEIAKIVQDFPFFKNVYYLNISVKRFPLEKINALKEGHVQSSRKSISRTKEFDRSVLGAKLIIMRIYFE